MQARTPRVPPAPRTRSWMTLAILVWASGARTGGAQAGPPAHGLWVWKSATVLSGATSADALRDFCRSNGVTEVYVSIAARDLSTEDRDLAHTIDVLHRSAIRVEGLLSSTNADEPGPHRDKLLDHVRWILQFNHRHPADRFDGIHLDIEPQQRPENKGSGNLRFLADLVDTYRAVRALAEAEQLTVNADVQRKLLEGSPADRQALLSALPRLTLMMYELSHPADPASVQADKVREASRAHLAMAYAGLTGSELATIGIALRTADYGERLPQMLAALDEANRSDGRYRGWARYSYNDYLAAGAH